MNIKWKNSAFIIWLKNAFVTDFEMCFSYMACGVVQRSSQFKDAKLT
jgi:hypothetical protein